MSSTTTPGGPGRRPRSLADGPIKQLVVALDELILAAHGDGRTSGSRQRLVDYVNACEPERRLSAGALSRQMGDLSRKPWGPEWRYVKLVVTYCVPAPLHRARRLALARGEPLATTTQDSGARVDADRQHLDALQRLAGLWCVAWKRQRPPDGYTDGIVWPDGSTDAPLEDPDDAEDLSARSALFERSYLAVRAELDVALRQVRHATAERERVRTELVHAGDAAELESAGRRAAESRNRELVDELADLSAERAHVEYRVTELQRTVASLTEQLSTVTSLLNGEVEDRRDAEQKVERLRRSNDELRQTLHSHQLRTADRNALLGTRSSADRPHTDHPHQPTFMQATENGPSGPHRCDDLARALDAEALWRLVDAGDRAAALRLPHVLEKLEDADGLWELFKRGNERAAASLAYVLMVKGDLDGLGAAIRMGNKYAGQRLTQARSALS